MKEERQHRLVAIVSPELRKWFKSEALRQGKTLNETLNAALSEYAEQRDFTPNWRSILCAK